MKKFVKIQFKYLKPIFVVLLFLLSVKFVFATNYIDSDNTSGGFGGGTHTNTQWDSGNSWLEMSSAGQTAGFATFTSRIIDGGFSGTWNTLSWVPQRPLMKELPDNAGTETAYTEGNVDMTSNKLLLHLNETSGTTFSDSSGQSHSVSCSNCPTLNSEGRLSSSLKFDGVNDSIAVTDAADLDGSSAMTVSLWVKPSTLTTYNGIISKWNSTVNGTGNSWAMRTDNSYSDELLIFLAASGSDAGGNYYVTSNANLAAGAWNHIVFVFDGSLSAANRLKVYINGSLVSGSITGSFPATLRDSGYGVTIGNYVVSNQSTFNGRIDEVALFQRALTSGEVTNIYKRAALRARFQARSCDDAACSGESFVGPAAATTDYFEEQDSNTTSLPSRTVSSIVSANRYFQYRVAMETVNSSLSSEIKSITVAGPTQGSVTVSSISGNTTEAGGTATYTVVLDSAPSSNVTIDVSSSNTAEGTVSPSILTFTTGNWSTPQTVTVTGVNDFVDDGNINYTIVNAAASSSDGAYNGVNPSDVSATNTDNDTAGITVSSISGNTTEAGDTATYTVVLDSEPTANVTIGVSSSDTTEGTVASSSLTFTSGNWNTPQTMTVTGVNDFLVDGSIGYTIVNAAASSSDTSYNNMNPSDVSVTNTDNDTVGFTVSAISGNTTELGGTATFTIVLNTQPSASVSVGISSSNTGEGTVSPSSVTFTTENWGTPQTVTVTGVSDNTVDGNVEYTIQTAVATSDDSSYNNVNPSDVSVTNEDDGSGGGGGGGGGGAAVPEFSDFLSIIILGIGGIFIHSRVKKIQSMKS